MMIKLYYKQLKFYLFLVIILFSQTLPAQTCKSFAEVQTGIDGTMSLSGDICLNDNSYSGQVNGSLNVIYKNYNANRSFSRDGLVVLTYSSNQVQPAPTAITETYHGGPITYIIGNTTYIVEFNNLTYSFDGTMKQTSESGSILLNGNKLDAKNVPYDYVKIY